MREKLGESLSSIQRFDRPLEQAKTSKLEAWKGIQTVIYDDAPLYKVGNFNALSGVSASVSGYTPTYWPRFWNVTPKK